MILPYVYKLTHKSTGQYYIGYRKANIRPAYEDLGVTYFTSSKLIQKLGFDNFNFEIISEFTDGDEAYDLEQSLIYDSIGDDKCLNQHYFKPGSKRFILRHHSTETIDKISKANAGRIHTEESRLKFSIAHIGNEHSMETKHKMRDSRTKKSFRVVSPNGLIYFGENLSQFCAQHGLNTGSMSLVCRGVNNRHKGWTGEYLDNQHFTKETK